MGEHNLSDHIDHPVHYTQGIECIDYILSHNMDYLEGNIVKYVTRYKLKHGVDDLRKAEWYLKRLLKREALGPAVTGTPDNYWPSLKECARALDAKGLPYVDAQSEHPEERFDNIGELEQEKRTEIIHETGEAMCEEFCRNYCDNYIKPHYPKLDGRNCR